MSFAAGAVVYAKDLAKVARFYATVAGLETRATEHDHVVLESPAFQLVIVAIPEAIAADIVIATPPVRRQSTAVKLVLPVPSLADARSRAKEFGGEVDAVEREWRFQGQLVCDGHDPEGNVVQLRQLAG